MKRDWIQTGRRPSGICGAGCVKTVLRLPSFLPSVCPPFCHAMCIPYASRMHPVCIPYFTPHSSSLCRLPICHTHTPILHTSIFLCNHSSYVITRIRLEPIPALLIAARLHGFRRTQQEVVRVVRICDVTLRKRLVEFSDTSLGRLTAAELESTDLESFGTPADPPSFAKARLLEEKQTRALAAPAREAARVQRELKLKSLRIAQVSLSHVFFSQMPQPHLAYTSHHRHVSFGGGGCSSSRSSPMSDSPRKEGSRSSSAG